MKQHTEPRTAQDLVAHLASVYRHSTEHSPDWRNGAAHLLTLACAHAHHESIDAAITRLDAMINR